MRARHRETIACACAADRSKPQVWTELTGYFEARFPLTVLSMYAVSSFTHVFPGFNHRKFTLSKKYVSVVNSSYQAISEPGKIDVMVGAEKAAFSGNRKY